MNFWDGGNLGDITDSILEIYNKDINEDEEKDKFGKLLVYFNSKYDKEEYEGILLYKFRLFSVAKTMNEKSKNEMRILDKCKELFNFEKTERIFGEINGNEYMLIHLPDYCEEYSIVFFNKFVKKYKLNEEEEKKILDEIRLCILFRIAFGIITISDSSILLRYYSDRKEARAVSYYETKTKIMGKKRILPNTILNKWFNDKEDYIKFLMKNKKFFKEKRLTIMEIIQSIDQNYLYLYNNFNLFFQL